MFRRKRKFTLGSVSSKKPRSSVFQRRPTRRKGAVGQSARIIRKDPYTYVARPLLNDRGSFMPQRYITTLRYSDRKAYAPGAVTDDIVIRGNGPQDCDAAAGVTEQGLGWAQLADIYSYYRVHWCATKLSFENQTAAVAAVITIVANNFGTDLAGESIISYPGAKSTVVPENEVRSISHFARSKAVMGPYYNDASSFAQTSAVPTNQWFFHHVIASIDGATNVSGNYLLQIWYNVEFWMHPVDLTQTP